MAEPKEPLKKKLAQYYDAPFDWLFQKDNAIEQPEQISNTMCIECIDDSADYKFLKMFKKLPDNKKYKVMGYIERLYEECMKTSQD